MNEVLVLKVKEIAVKHAKDLSKEIINEVLFAAIDEAVKKTATPIDDVIVAALKEPMKQALLDLIEKA